MRKILQPIFAVAGGLALGLSITALAGENPLNVLKILAKGAFGSRYDLGMTLFYTTPLIFTGLSVAIALRSGLFNIGAEGQLNMGALSAAAVGATVHGVPPILAPCLAGLAAMAGGMLWGFIPGWLRARRGSHEVINTIMLNFVAAGLTSYATLYLLKNPDSQNPETRPIDAAYHIPSLALFGGAPVSWAMPLALITALATWFLMKRTRLGFELQAVGANETAARASGINSGNLRIIAFALSGGLAGLVGVAEVLGNAGNYKMGFSPEYGFTGIAVALLGRNHPGGIVAAALLFGALHKGAADLDFETEHVTRELSMVLQALIIISVSADGLWQWVTISRARQRPPVPGPAASNAGGPL